MIGTNYCFQVEKEVEAEGFTWDLALELNFKGKHRIAKIKKRKGLFLEKTKGADGHRRRVAIHPNTLGSHGKKRSPDEQQRSKCLHVAGTSGSTDVTKFHFPLSDSILDGKPV